MSGYSCLVVAVLNLAMLDGSRKFGELAQRVDWYAVRDHVLRLPGASLIEFSCDGVTEAWVDFAYGGNAFTINDQFEEYWFFVSDPACPETLLRTVLEHFESLIVRRACP
jgi:hypothetical protein